MFMYTAAAAPLRTTTYIKHRQNILNVLMCVYLENYHMCNRMLHITTHTHICINKQYEKANQDILLVFFLCVVFFQIVCRSVYFKIGFSGMENSDFEIFAQLERLCCCCLRHTRRWANTFSAQCCKFLIGGKIN